MEDTLIYRHWQPGDDDAILNLLVPAEQCNENYYRRKFNTPNLEPKDIRIALDGERVVGHVYGTQATFFIEGKVQDFGIVSIVYVATEMRRQGIATRLMQDLNAHFEDKGYRGSLLYVETSGAFQLYRKVGYRELTKELRTILKPRTITSPLKWSDVKPDDYDDLKQVKERWTKMNFPVFWNPNTLEIHQRNMDQYRVLRRGTKILGYANWYEPSEHCPNGLISDPIVPDETPIEVIRSVQAMLSSPHEWKTVEGSRYEDTLISIGCTLQKKQNIDMLLSFGEEINLTGTHRTWW